MTLALKMLAVVFVASLASPDSVEGQLTAQGRSWTTVRSDVRSGAYVQDLVQSRASQPDGRGTVGRVVSLRLGADGQAVAKVDFGRGYSVELRASELAMLRISAPQPVVADSSALSSSYPGVAASSPGDEAAAPDSVEGQLRAQGKQWARRGGEITLGAYVQDILIGRANQPDGRGNIGRVTALAYGPDGEPDAMVDFGRGYAVGIHLRELTLIQLAP